MDNKILQQNLADALAERSNITKRKAEAFVRSFFEATENALIRDGIVKVKGFGTTKIISVSERESVNINTGERFQIESHDKITFTPDNTFRDLVNRPFAHFTTIVLEDTVDESELATEVVTDSEDIDYQNEDTDEEISVAGEHILAAVEPEEESLSPTEIPTPLQEEASTEDDHTEIYEPVQPALDEKQETELTEEQEAELTEEQDVELPASAQDVIATAYTTAEGTTDDPLIEIPITSTDNEATSSSNLENATDMNQQPIIIQNSVPPSSHNWWKSAFFVLTTLVLMTLSYFAGYYRIFCPCEASIPEAPAEAPAETSIDSTSAASVSKEAPTAVETPAQTETGNKGTEQHKAKIQQQEMEEATRKAAAKYKQMEGEYLITGVLERHTMKAGDNLYKLAKNAYGDKELATYIIFHNNITNPDVIGLGQTIEIPKLSKK